MSFVRRSLKLLTVALAIYFIQRLVKRMTEEESESERKRDEEEDFEIYFDK